MPKRVLMVEDTISLAALYRGHLEAEGFKVDAAETGSQARRFCAANDYDAILLDLGLPDIPGIELLSEFRENQSGASIVIITANASISMAVQAVREGAYDYLIKPVTRDRLITTIKNALERTTLRQALKTSPARDTEGSFHGFIGASPVMCTIYQKIKSVAQSKASVFITGESGTGKELCAEAVHALSPRAAGPFVAINCGAIPKDLMESEIFGHLKGSFTGAISDREGAARLADGGTLFLDEICELDLALQTKLLRFLQTGLIQRVGSAATEEVDIRVICATNRLPLDEVRAGRFREDLYFRLHVLPVHLPPLRERGQDTLDIANHFLNQFAVEEGKRFKTFSNDAQSALIAHNWPGNIRELQNAVRQAIVLHDADIVERHMLDPLISAIQADNSALALEVDGLRQAAETPVARSLAGLELWQIEKQAIESTI
ncbi:MAG: sigma-54-dependent transcriptional regulator, partial [Aestuariivirgaceae bacterium]